MKAIAAFCCVFLPVLAAGVCPDETVSPDRIGGLIPPMFPDRDISSYTVRYLSEKGEDTAACLENQLESVSNSTLRCCHTLRYSLRTADPINCTSAGTPAEERDVCSRYLILLVSGGNYSFSTDRNLYLLAPRNVIIAKNRQMVGEAVLQCNAPNDTDYNNIYFRNLTNVALNGLTFAHCGQRSTAVFIKYGNNFTMEDCVLRY